MQTQDTDTVDFVAPCLRPGQQPLSLSASPVDLLWAVLCYWPRQELVDFMHVLHACATRMPTDQEQGGRGLHDTSFWSTHPVPVLLPRPAFLEPDEAFLALADTMVQEKEAEEQLILNSMRFAAVLGLVHDMRMRHMALVPHEGIHPLLHMRPCETWRFWQFLMAGPQRILAWVLRRAMLDQESLTRTAPVAVEALGDMWCQLVPVPGPWDDKHDEDDNDDARPWEEAGGGSNSFSD